MAATMAVDPQFNALRPPTPEEREKRRQEIAAVRAQLLARADGLFAAFRITFGDEEGRRLWRDKLTRRRGRKPGKPTRSGKYQMLLSVRDALVAAGVDKKRVPALIAKWIKAHPHSDFGNTKMVAEEALEQGLRRALKRREKDRRENPLNALLAGDS
jgi:hypothetical protein